jgi:hypothetical protein
MDEIEKGRVAINRRVMRYLQAHPTRAYDQVATHLGVSRWRVLMVASAMGISRKTGPKPKRADKAKLPTISPETPLERQGGPLP